MDSPTAPSGGEREDANPLVDDGWRLARLEDEILGLKSALGVSDSSCSAWSVRIAAHRLRADRDALLSAQPQPGAGESCWLVEHATDPKWWTGWPGNESDPEFWTADSLEALRFGRQRDAEAMAAWTFDGECRITEHAWDMGKPASPIPAGVSEEDVARINDDWAFRPGDVAFKHRQQAHRDYALSRARAILALLRPENKQDLRADSTRLDRPQMADEGSEPSAAWRPIETAPKDGTAVLVGNVGRADIGSRVVARVKPGWPTWSTIPGDYTVKPTRWLPLPPAPVLKPGGGT